MRSFIANAIVLLIVAAIVFFAVRSIIKKKGGCSCGCGSCNCGCGGSKKKESSDANN